MLKSKIEPPNGPELSCPAEAGRPPSLYATPVGQASDSFGPARRVSFSEIGMRRPVPHSACFIGLR